MDLKARLKRVELFTKSAPDELAVLSDDIRFILDHLHRLDLMRDEIRAIKVTIEEKLAHRRPDALYAFHE